MLQYEAIPDITGTGIAIADNAGVLVALVEVDDWEVLRGRRGDHWAATVLVALDGIVADAGKKEVNRLSMPVPQASWIVAIWRDDARRLLDDAVQMADEIREAVALRVNATVSVSVSDVHVGPGAATAATTQALRQLSVKLVRGGNRVWAGGDPAFAKDPKLPQFRIEQRIAAFVHAGNVTAIVDVLDHWMDKLSECGELSPTAMRQWLLAQLLYLLEITGTHRLHDGSVDWVHALSRCSVFQLQGILEIHERSNLTAALSKLVGGLFQDDTVSQPLTAGGHLISQVERYIQDNYASDLNLSTVAAAVYVSPYYVSRLFQQERGTTFLKYLTGVRLQHARRLLLQSELPVDVVARHVGYTSSKRFRVIFKRAMSMTPTAYRRVGEGSQRTSASKVLV